jgi:hypothetical protein
MLELPGYPSVIIGDNDPQGNSWVNLVTNPAPQLSSVYENSINQALAANRWDAAEALYMRALRARPYDPQNYINLMNLYSGVSHSGLRNQDMRNLEKVGQLYRIYQSAFPGKRIPSVESRLGWRVD